MRPLTLLRVLTPQRYLFSAVFQKEVASAGRRVWTYMARSLYTLALLGVSAIVLTAIVTNMHDSSAAGRLRALSTVAPTLAIVVGWVQLVGLSVHAPTLTASALSEERSRRTLPSLATTPLTPLQIVFSKLSSRLVQTVILVLVAAPLLLLLRIFGGLRAETVLAVTALSLSTAMFTGSLGLLYSLWHRRASAAFVMASLTVILVFIAPVILIALLEQFFGIDEDILVFGVAYIHPVVAMAMVTADAMGPMTPFASVTLHWIGASAAMLVLALLTNLLTASLLRRVMLSPTAGAWQSTRKERKRKQKAARTHRKMREVARNPVYWRERRLPMLSSRAATIGLVIVLAVIIFFLAITTDLNDRALHAPIGVILMLANLLVAAVAGAAAVAGEREARTWDVLLQTPLSGRRILTSKFLAALTVSSIIPLIAAARHLLFWALGVGSPLAFVSDLVLFGGSAALLIAIGVFVSLHVKKISTASNAAMGIALLIWLVIPIVTLVLASLLIPSSVIEEVLTPILFFTNPVPVAAYNGLFSLEASNVRPLAGVMFELGPLASIGALTHQLLVMLVGGSMLILAIAILEAAIVRFPRKSGRLS